MSSDETTTSTYGLKRKRDNFEEKLPITKRTSIESIYKPSALLVDGELMARITEQAMLVTLGIETLVHNSAHDALRFLSTNVRFDFIIVDFDLPLINGPEFVRHVRSMGIRSKILGLCTNYNAEKRRLFYSAGADIAIKKPVYPGTLAEVLEHLRSL